MKTDAIDELLRLAYLEGLVSTRGAYEKSVLKKQVQAKIAPGKRERLIHQLESALVAGKADPLLTVGVFLKQVRTQGKLRAEDLSRRLGISRNVYQMLEHDRISPLRIPAGVWGRFITLFQVSSETFAELLHKTHRLVFFSPAFRTTLARYDSRKKKRGKSETLERAAREMYARSTLALPPEEEQRLNALITEVTRT